MGSTGEDLQATDSTLFDQTMTPSDNAAGDRFGETLAAGDFNDDGRDDLAIGAPAETDAGGFAAVEVTLLFGSASGLTSAGASVLNQTVGAPGVSEASNRFASALATGDTHGDDHSDLAVESEGEDAGKSRVVV